MVFNSVVFLVFLAVVLTAYYVLPFRWQNPMLLVASYVFYGWWDERFLFLIVLSTCVDFWAGLLIDRGKLTPRQRVEPSLVLLLAAVAFLGMDWPAAPAASTPLALVADGAAGDGLNLTLGSQGRWGVCLAVAAGLVVVQLLIEAVDSLVRYRAPARGAGGQYPDQSGCAGVLQVLQFLCGKHGGRAAIPGTAGASGDAEHHSAGGHFVLHVSDHELRAGRLSAADAGHGQFPEFCVVCQFLSPIGGRPDRAGGNALASGGAAAALALGIDHQWPVSDRPGAVQQGGDRRWCRGQR